MIVGDFNRSPKDIAGSTWCKFLKGTVLAPDIPFTCTNSSEAGGALIDFCMHCVELTPYLRVEPRYDYGFKPHIVSLRYFVDKEVLADTGWVIDAPLEIS